MNVDGDLGVGTGRAGNRFDWKSVVDSQSNMQPEPHCGRPQLSAVGKLEPPLAGAAATLSCLVIFVSPQSGQLGFSLELRTSTSMSLSHWGQ